MSDAKSSCKGCKFYKPTDIFELCKHKTSEYFAMGKQDWHTVSHMTSHRGACSENRALYAK